jgi:GT2 family glycosyltransferase
VKIRGYGQLDHGQYNSPGPLEYATGCALLVRRQVFEKIGGFDEDYESYMEDYDFCYRSRQAGFSLGYHPRAVVYHRGSMTLQSDPARIWWYLGRNTVLFYRKYDRFPAWMLRLFLAWTAMREIVKGKPWRVKAFIEGYRRGYEQLQTTNEL